MQDFINTKLKNNRLDIRVVKREHTHIYFRKALKINMQTEDTYLSRQNFSSQGHQLKTIDFNTI